MHDNVKRSHKRRAEHSLTLAQQTQLDGDKFFSLRFVVVAFLPSSEVHTFAES